MDDLVLIADSKQKTELLLETTNQFFKINSLTCNKEKTKIINNIKIKNRNQNHIIFDNLPIQILKPQDNIKYLGTLISPLKMLKNNRKLFIQSTLEIINELMKTNYKGEIKQQISEWTIFGKFEYFLSTSYLNQTSIHLLQSKLNNFLKKAYKISSKCSNKILISHGGLNITLFEERQNTTLINNLITKLASPVTNKYINQEIRSIQKKEAIWHCPICHPNEFNQDNWILHAARTAKNLEIHICPPTCPFQMENSQNSIGYLFNKLPKQQKNSAINTITALDIKFTNQLLRFNESTKLTWSQLISHTGKVRCGPEPIWFKNFTNTTNLLGSHGPIPNPKLQFWLINNSRTIAKIHKRQHNIRENEILKGRHYIVDIDNNLIKCNGCPLGISTNDICRLTFTSSEASSLWTTLTNSNYSKYRLNNIINETINYPQNNEHIAYQININQDQPPPSPLSEIGIHQHYHFQIYNNNIIINETETTPTN
jgi:hypothetical protein